MLSGLHFLSDIIDYTIWKQPLEITYHLYHGEPRSVLIHPYHVKQYNNRWYLLGHDQVKNRLSNLALDRMERVVKSGVPFIENNEVNFSTFFNDVIDVTVPDEDIRKETFILRFAKKRFPYILSKPIHSSQKIYPDCSVSLELRPNRGFESLLFSFGPDVEILAPNHYRDSYMEKSKKS